MSDKRLYGLDVSRGVAMIIMFMSNFAAAMNTFTDGPNWLVFIYQKIQGKGAAIFVILAGIGISLMTKRQRENGTIETRNATRNTLLRRAVFLAVIGLAFYTVWSADILHYYGAYIAIAAFLLWEPTSTLINISGLFAIGFNLLILIFNYDAGWQNGLDYTGFWTLNGFTRNLFFNGFHPIFPWQAFILMGMVIGRMDIRERETRNQIIMKSFKVFLLSSILSMNAGYVFQGSEIADLVSTSIMPPGIFYLLVAGSLGIAVTMGFQTLVEDHPDSNLLNILASMGRLALSHYIGHVIIGVFTIFLLEPLVEFNLVTSLYFSIGYTVFASVSSIHWEKSHGRGPVESLMRRITG